MADLEGAPIESSSSSAALTAAGVQIQGLDSSVAGLDGAVEPIEDGQQYKLVFPPTPRMAKGPFRGQVELSTHLRQEPRLTVGLSGEVL